MLQLSIPPRCPKRRTLRAPTGDPRGRPTPIEPSFLLCEGDGQGNVRRPRLPSLDRYDGSWAVAVYGE